MGGQPDLGAASPVLTETPGGFADPGARQASALLAAFHTVHGVLLEKILECVAIASSSGPHFVTTLHYDSSVLSGPAQYGS